MYAAHWDWGEGWEGMFARMGIYVIWSPWRVFPYRILVLMVMLRAHGWPGVNCFHCAERATIPRNILRLPMTLFPLVVCKECIDCPQRDSHAVHYINKAGSLKMNTALEYVQYKSGPGGRRCKKSTLNDLVHLTPLRIPLMNPPIEEREGSLYSRTLLTIPRWLNNCCKMQILHFLYWQISWLWIETVQCTL